MINSEHEELVDTAYYDAIDSEKNENDTSTESGSVYTNLNGINMNSYKYKFKCMLEDLMHLFGSLCAHKYIPLETQI